MMCVAGEQGSLAWDTHGAASVAVAMAVAAADLARQLEVMCADRGRLFVLVWNLYTAALAVHAGAHLRLPSYRTGL
jgi:hypothetical protein